MESDTQLFNIIAELILLAENHREKIFSSRSLVLILFPPAIYFFKVVSLSQFSEQPPDKSLSLQVSPV